MNRTSKRFLERVCGWKADEDGFGLKLDIEPSSDSFADVLRQRDQLGRGATAIVNESQRMSGRRGERDQSKERTLGRHHTSRRGRRTHGASRREAR